MCARIHRSQVFNSCYGQISSLFFIYWFQDEVGANGFSLLGHHITDSAQTALAFTNTIGTVAICIKIDELCIEIAEFCIKVDECNAYGQVVGFVVTLPGGWIADHWVENRATILLIASLIQTSSPLINAFLPTFSWVCFTSLVSSVVNGLAGAVRFLH